jgi:hypothetical protein
LSARAYFPKPRKIIRFASTTAVVSPPGRLPRVR